MLNWLKKIIGSKIEFEYHYLVYYEGPYGLAECIMSNSELAKMIREWSPRLISISPAIPAPAGIVREVA